MSTGYQALVASDFGLPEASPLSALPRPLGFLPLASCSVDQAHEADGPCFLTSSPSSPGLPVPGDCVARGS